NRTTLHLEGETPLVTSQWEMINGAGGQYAGNGAHFLQYLLIERGGVTASGLLCAQDSNHHREHIVRIESRVNVLYRNKSADHQPRAGQQNHGESKLRAYEQAAQAVAAYAFTRSALSFLQRLTYVGSRGLPCRKDSED